MVGTEDSIIPPNHSADLFTKAKEPKALWVVDGAEHVECIDNEALKNDLAIVIGNAMKGECDLDSDFRYYDHDE